MKHCDYLHTYFMVNIYKRFLIFHTRKNQLHKLFLVKNDKDLKHTKYESLWKIMFNLGHTGDLSRKEKTEILCNFLQTICY